MLLKSDHDYLVSKGYRYTVTPGGQGAYLVIEEFPVASSVYDRDRVALMLQIPSGYNMARLDMFYVDPALHFRSGAFPQAANVVETHLGRNWQRFSRHLKSDGWKPGIDGVPMFLRFIRAELQGRN